MAVFMAQTGISLPHLRNALQATCVVTILATTVGFSGTALAQSNSTSEAKSGSTQWGLGIAAGVFQRPFEGAGNKTRVIPLLYVDNDWLRVSGPTADLKLGTLRGNYGTLLFTGRLKYEGFGYEAKDSPSLAGLDERKESFWAGGTVSWDTSVARTTLEWTGDASGNSKGQQLQLQVDRRFHFGALSITPRVQAQWLDKKYVDYYYGVQAHEGTSSRAKYTGKSATTFGVGVRLDYQLQPRHTVYLDVSATSLPDEIKNSPIVGRSSVSRAGIGYLYRF